MQKHLRIGFINPPHADWCLTNTATWVFVKSYFTQKSPFADRVTWTEPAIKFNQYQSIDEVCAEVADCDVVLFSSYIWNYDLCDAISVRNKELNSDVVHLLGGPHIGLNDSDFFSSRPKYDYYCKATKPGEAFMLSLLNQYFSLGSWPSPEDVDWEMRSALGTTVDLPDFSVYRQNIEYFKKISVYAHEHKLEPFVIIETTRGCPHNCVYCEWGGGTNSKIVQKKLEIVKDDIRALKEAGFNAAYLTDANFGIFESRDVEIYRYAKQIDFGLTDISTMKSRSLEKRKKLVDAWFDVMGAAKTYRTRTDKTVRVKEWDDSEDNLVCPPTVSIQSISEEAMRVAQRVDLSFNDKIELSRHIQQRSEQQGFPIPPLELILAMPGSTIEDFYQEMNIIWSFKAWSSFRHDYMILPDTFLSDPEYLKKYQIESVSVFTDLVDEAGIDNRFTLYEGRRTYFKTVRSCYSYTYEEFKEMFFMNSAANYLLEKFYPMFLSLFSPPEFGKICYAVIRQLDGYSLMAEEIDDIFNPCSRPRSIKKLQGHLRTKTIELFLENNKTIIINEIFHRMMHNADNRGCFEGQRISL